MQEVTFRVDYAVASIGREFGTVILDDKNVAMLVVAEGWAKVIYIFFCGFGSIDFCFFLGYLLAELCSMQVKEQGSQKGEASPFLAELLRLEEQAKQQGVGRWSKVILFPYFLFVLL